MKQEEISKLELRINHPKAHQNWSKKLNEKWLNSPSGEDYYILKDGSLFKYSGRLIKLLNSQDELVAKLDPSYFYNLQKFNPGNFSRSGYALHSYQAIQKKYQEYITKFLNRDSEDVDQQLKLLNDLFIISGDDYDSFVIKFDAVLHELKPDHNNKKLKLTEYLANNFNIILAYQDSGNYAFIPIQGKVKELKAENTSFAEIFFSHRYENFDYKYIESNLKAPETLNPTGTILGYSLSVEYNDRLVENCAIINNNHINKIGADTENVIINELAHKNLKRIFKDADNILGINHNFFNHYKFKFIENNKQFNELMSDIASMSFNEEAATIRILIGVAKGINSANYHASHTISKNSLNAYLASKNLSTHHIDKIWQEMKTWDFKEFKAKFNSYPEPQQSNIQFNEFILLLEDQMLEIGNELMEYLEKNYAEYLFLENL